MGSQLQQQLAPCFYFLLLILTIPNSQAKSCRSTDVDKDPVLPYYGDDEDAFSASLDTLCTYEMVTESGILKDLTRPELAQMPDDAPGLLLIPRRVQLCNFWAEAHKIRVVEMSFEVSFTMSIDEQPGKLNQTRREGTGQISFLIVPAFRFRWLDARRVAQNVSLAKQLALGADGSLDLKDAASGGSSNVSVQIGSLDGGMILLNVGTPLGVNVAITEPAPSAAAARYTVWIDYDSPAHRLSVYVGAGEGSRRPDKPVAVKEHVRLTDGAYSSARFGLFSSARQLLQVYKWNSNVAAPPVSFTVLSIFGVLVLIVAPTILLSVAAIVGVACYFKSKKRRWKKEQEKLAKTMQRLPGVPTKIEYADIRNATNNFHNTTKLGRGGFSSVYRCRLPGAASRTGQAMEVAVKKFTREVEDQRLEDFLAEVSIINCLRHKNIVPLIGWSYHKGVPLLIYEYMTNGSLDQHLFRRGGTAGKQQEDTAIRQWITRCSIVRDIAAGLNYVHHEHEPMVLHRDIKASNIMLDSNFHARLGDFGIASTVSADRSSVTGIAGTWGYISPEYAVSHRATRQTDIYAFGVLVLELVTGRKWDVQLQPDDDHITDWVWRLHGEGRLLEAVDGVLAEEIQKVDADGEAEAERLLLLGLACTNPNPSSRPSMAEAVQVITKLAPPPEVPPEKPTFVWPPEDWRSLDTDCSTTVSNLDRSWGSTVELVQVGLEERQPVAQSTVSTSM